MPQNRLQGRKAPAQSPGYERARADDAAFFAANPGVTERYRLYIPGEAPGMWPPGTIVHVKRLGRNTRFRGFIDPPVEGN